MGLVKHARYELERAGLFDKDCDYGGATAKSVMKLMRVFAKQGHSGFSAMKTIGIFSILARFETLTPITSDASEWNDVSKESGYPFWQNNRDSRYFSKDGGKTWYNVDDVNKGFFRKIRREIKYNYSRLKNWLKKINTINYKR